MADRQDASRTAVARERPRKALALGERRGADDLIDFAEGQGYTFTVEEASREVSHSELESVAGGTTFTKSTYSYEEPETFEHVTASTAPADARGTARHSTSRRPTLPRSLLDMNGPQPRQVAHRPRSR